MRLPRFRFTMRRLMVVVLALSLTFGMAVMLLRRAEYRRQAISWEGIARLAKDDLDGHGPGVQLGVDPKESRLLFTYYDSLRQKYEYAASHPWLSVEPDPPNPLSSLGIPGPPAPTP
jgi:hypothetical protein